MPLVSLFLLLPMTFVLWFGGFGDLVYSDLLTLVVSKELFMLFNCFFACIAIILVWGGVLERISYKGMLLFSFLWLLFVYFPVAHQVINHSGYFHGLGIIDFAGGFNVHMTSGVSALVLANCLGRRIDYFNLKNKFSQQLIFIGTILIWIGWVGFNGGSSLLLNKEGILAVQNTIIAPIFSVLTWMLIDYMYTPHKVTLINISLAVVSGLVAITPGAGLLTLWQSVLVGLMAGVICNFSARLMHKLFKVDDTLDVFSTHAIGGAIGAFMTPIFLGVSTSNNLLTTIAIFLYSGFVTYVIVKLVGLFVPLRLSKDLEEKGLDIEYHGENIINL